MLYLSFKFWAFCSWVFLILKSRMHIRNSVSWFLLFIFIMMWLLSSFIPLASKMWKSEAKFYGFNGVCQWLEKHNVVAWNILKLKQFLKKLNSVKTWWVLLSHIRLCEHVCICYVFCQTMEVRLLYIFSFAPLS